MMNRMNMSLASLMAGIAFDNTGVHLGHAFGHMLGAKYHVSHGVGCALLLPEILEIILPARLERLARKEAVVFVLGFLVVMLGRTSSRRQGGSTTKALTPR